MRRAGGVVEHPVVVLVRPLAGPAPSGPIMFLGRVVQDKIDADAHAAGRSAAVTASRSAMVPSARIDLAVVHHRIAAVAVAGAWLQARHEMHIGGAEFFKVVGALSSTPLQRAVEAVDIEDIAHHVLALEPVGLEIALQDRDGTVALAVGLQMSPRQRSGHGRTAKPGAVHKAAQAAQRGRARCVESASGKISRCWAIQALAAARSIGPRWRR